MKNKQKNVEQVKGAQIGCSDFEPCPLCYGCRAFSTSRVKCVNQCGTNEKFDTCNTARHQTGLLARMITKERIVVKGVPNRTTQSNSPETKA